MPDVRWVLAVALVLVLGARLPAEVVPSGRYKLLLDGEEPKDLKRPPPKGTEVGMTAQEIAGEDLDGKKFKLSHYRGRVVLLVFWGHWCGPSRSMYPYERALLARMADRPFAVVGVNSDRDRDAIKKTMADEKLTWRSFWNDGGPNGPIARDWKVQGWPTLYLIDHKGVIRHKYLGTQQPAVLDKAIDDLLKDVKGR
jgi:thiol-disulfide isomerase/thioredoxin